MIGLERNTVQIIDYCKDWAVLGEEACQNIQQVAGDLIIDVQHAGSTSVPGLLAKPIIDLVIGISSTDVIPTLIEKLASLGYIYRGEGKGSIGHLFVWESSPDVRTIHVHVVKHNSTHWKDYIDFRDILRKDNSILERYAELKRKLNAKYAGDRKRYTSSKSDFIRSILNTTWRCSGLAEKRRPLSFPFSGADTAECRDECMPSLTTRRPRR